jgi:hypothetical protein
MAKLSRFGFRFKSISLPEIEEFFDENMETPLKTAATRSFETASVIARTKLRTQVRRNFKNRLTGKARFEKSFNAWAYPDKSKAKVSMRPAVTIQANPSWAEIFEEGRPKTVRPAVSRFLAIPTDEAEKRGLAKVGEGRGWNRRLSQTSEAKGIGPTAVVKTDKGLFLTAKDGDETLFLFKLVREAREQRRISLMDISDEAMDRIPGLFSAALAKAQK